MRRQFLAFLALLFPFSRESFCHLKTKFILKKSRFYLHFDSFFARNLKNNLKKLKKMSSIIVMRESFIGKFILKLKFANVKLSARRETI